jgi:hypothetical protein
MPSSRTAEIRAGIEKLFLLQETATIEELFEAVYGRKMEYSKRRGSQAVGPALTRYYRATGNNVRPTGDKPYTYTIEYA